jgi:hypothetical protein
MNLLVPHKTENFWLRNWMSRGSRMTIIFLCSVWCIVPLCFNMLSLIEPVVRARVLRLCTASLILPWTFDLCKFLHISKHQGSQLVKEYKSDNRGSELNQSHFLLYSSIWSLLKLTAILELPVKDPRATQPFRILQSRLFIWYGVFDLRKDSSCTRPGRQMYTLQHVKPGEYTSCV